MLRFEHDSNEITPSKITGKKDKSQGEILCCVGALLPEKFTFPN
jgi:hypothetical protein